MSDKKTALTPIIVGAVIALIGILTGLYVAVNAREQLAAATLEADTAAVSDEVEDNSEAADVDMQALPDLPAVEVTDSPNVDDEELPDDEQAEEPLPEVPAAPVEDNHTTVDEPVIEDDFVPVSPEEIEQAIP